MMIALWKKINYFTGMLALSALLGLVIFLCNSQIGDFDLWLHLKTGEIIIEQGFIPLRDVFSCVMTGQPWNNHEWLFQAIFYLFLSVGGYDGLFAAQAIIVALTFLTLIFMTDIKHRHYFTVFLLFTLTLVYQTRLTMRPDLFSLFFFTLYLYTLSIHLHKRISIWFLFVVQILWVNMHGFFIFGPLLVALSLVCELIKRYVPLPWSWNKIGRLEDKEFEHLKVILIATFLACFVNPQTVKGALYPFAVIFQMAGESSLFFDHIQELKKPISWATLFSQRYIHFKALILVSFYSFVINRKRIDISALALWLFFLVFSLQAIRNLVFFGITAYLVTMLNFSERRFEDILPVRFKRYDLKMITVFLLNIAMIFWILRFANIELGKISFDFEQYTMRSNYGGVDTRSFPWDATDFINKNKIEGNFFNDFNTGAFLIGRCSPRIKVFMDGRTELYGPRFFKEYSRILEGDQTAFTRAVKKYRLTGVFLGSAHNEIPEKILRHLHQDKDWVLVYVGHDAVVFLKDVAKNKKAIELFRKDEHNIRFEPFDFKRLGSRGVFPYREIKRAYNLESLNFDDLASLQAKDAMFISPGSSEPYYILGLIAKKKGKTEEAFKNFRIATMISPDDADMRYHLGLSYFELKDYARAILEYERILKREKKRSDVHLSSAQAYFAQEKYGKAMESFRKAFALKTKNVQEMMKLADTFVAKKKFDEAFEIYTALLKVQPRNAHLYYKISVCFESLGRHDKAKEVLLRGLRIDRTSKEIQKSLGMIKDKQK
jgi:tetratricopeptide (TPR) repeat protein